MTGTYPGSGGGNDDRFGQPYVQGQPQGYPPPPYGQPPYGPTPYGPPPYGPPSYGQGGPGGYPPPPKSKLPFIIGGIVGVVAIAVAAVVVMVSMTGGDDSGSNTATASGTSAPGTSGPGSPQTSATTPASGEDISYEIAGTIDGPIKVGYTGESGERVEVQVDSLPWSVSIPKAPLIISISAVQINRPDRPNPDVTIVIKKGGKVVKSCTGGMPCIAVP